MYDYDLSSLKRRKKDDVDDQSETDDVRFLSYERCWEQYESFNISKELNKIREKVQDKKNKKRFGY